MIAEDYVSFEIAKLLKEKGFDADIDLWYNSDGEIFHLYHYDYNATKHFACVQCPTLQMAMKWLTEVPINDKAAKDIEYIRKDALISFLEKEKDDLYNWHFHDEDRKFKVYEEVIGKIKEL